MTYLIIVLLFLFASLVFFVVYTFPLPSEPKQPAPVVQVQVIPLSPPSLPAPPLSLPSLPAAPLDWYRWRQIYEFVYDDKLTLDKYNHLPKEDREVIDQLVSIDNLSV